MFVMCNSNFDILLRGKGDGGAERATVGLGDG
jgi:hypothetical protein